jgi:hypothetical protein
MYRCSYLIILQEIPQKNKNELEFIEARENFPTIECVCCKNLWFQRSTKEVNKETLYCKYNENVKKGRQFDENEFESFFLSNSNSNSICITCKNDIEDGKIPTIAIQNGLEFPEVPECVRNLNPLEERLVSPLICFIQIRELKAHTHHPQLGAKG